jgi:hypothetical protein
MWLAAGRCQGYFSVRNVGSRFVDRVRAALVRDGITHCGYYLGHSFVVGAAISSIAHGQFAEGLHFSAFQFSTAIVMSFMLSCDECVSLE